VAFELQADVVCGDSDGSRADTAQRRASRTLGLDISDHFRSLCELEVPDDGLVFSVDTVTVGPIREDQGGAWR
jgi:hypothetical protein